MRLLKHLRNQALGLIILGTAGYVAYQILLDDKAKQGVKSLIHTVGDSYTQLTSIVNSQIGTIMDEEMAAQNRQQISDAWEAIGF